MRARLAAGAAGLVLLAIAVVVFGQTRHPEVAGTNSVAPYTPAWSIPAVASRCQLLKHVPGGANRIRMEISTAPEDGPLQVAIIRHGTPVAQGQIEPKTGTVNFKLGRQLPAIRRGRICISNLGNQRIVFLGEHKRTRHALRGGWKRPVPSVIFLKPNTSSWFGRAGTIERRFGYVQAGILGEWTLWLAGALGLAMFAVALWLVIAQPEFAKPLWGIPVAGWLCALVALLSALTWSLIVPLFQVPDEQAHVAYAQHLAEVGAPPAGQSGKEALSEEERNLLTGLHWRAITHRADNPPLRTPRAHRHLERLADRPADRAGQGGFSNATQNPPLYYALAAVGYRASPWTDLPDRVHAMRVISALFVALTALFAFLFVRELLPGTPSAWAVAGLAVAVQPMLGFVGGGVNNDSLLFALSAASFYCLALSFRRGLTVRRGIVIGALVAGGMLTKATMAGLVPGIVLGVALIVWKSPPERRREALRAAAAAAGVAAAPLLLYMALNSVAWDRGVLFGSPQAEGQRAASAAINSRAGTLSGHLSYIWQFYLPRLQVMASWFPTYEAKEIWFDGFIGRFGWLDYEFPAWVYDFGLAAAVGVAVLAARELITRADAVRRRFPELITYVIIALGLLALLGWIGYDWRLGHAGQFEQARYILPLLALYGGLIALAVRGGRRWGPVIGVLIVSLALIQAVLGMLVTLTRYYG